MKFLALILSLLVSASAVAQSINTIHIASDSWKGYTNPDGTGLYFDMLRLVYEPVGIEIHYTITPYKRSVLLVASKEQDAWIASYKDEVADAIYPQKVLGYDEVFALYKKEKFPNWKGEISLKNKSLVWVRGYGYEDYLNVEAKWQEVNERGQAIKMLGHERVDAFLDDVGDINSVINKNRLDMDIYAKGLVFFLDLYVGFANTPKGQALADIWDERMEALISSGEIKTLWENWPNAPYPFD